MQHNRQPNMLGCRFREQETFGMGKDANKTLAWSSINSNPGQYQEIISPLDYKVSNPSSSLIMSSLSNIYQHYQQQNMYTQNEQNQNSSAYHQNINMNMINNSSDTLQMGNNKFIKNKNRNSMGLQVRKRGNSKQTSFVSLSGEIETKQSDSYSIGTAVMGKRKNLGKANINSLSHRMSDKQSDSNFYEYLVNESESNKQKLNRNQKGYISSQAEYIVRDSARINLNSSINQKPQLFQSERQLSMEESLLHLQHSQEELGYLKLKLQQAYQKLQKEILHSYELQEAIQSMEQQLTQCREERDQNKYQLNSITQQYENLKEMLVMERKENQKLKFTLKTIIKNQTLKDQLIGMDHLYTKNNQTNRTQNENNEIQEDSGSGKKSMMEESLVREKQLKENLKLKLTIKELYNTISFNKKSNQQLMLENNKLKAQLKSISQVKINLQQQLASFQKTKKSQLQELRAKIVALEKQNMQLQTRTNDQKTQSQLQSAGEKARKLQLQYSGRINILQQQLKTVTDEKVTITTRLKHEITLLHSQLNLLLQENHALKINMQQHTPITGNNLSASYVAYSPNVHTHSPNGNLLQMNNNNPSGLSNNKNYSKVPSQDNNKQTTSVQGSLIKQKALIFDSQDQNERNLNINIKNDIQTKIEVRNKRERNFTASNYSQDNKSKANSNNNNNKHNNNKQNLSNNTGVNCNNMDQNQSSKTEKSVGKWKRSHSLNNSNNSSIYVENNSHLSNQQSHHQQQYQQEPQPQSINQLLQQSINNNMPSIDCPTQKLIQAKLSQIQNEDQKLSKYQQHRKNIESELQHLQKIKRPSKQERQKIQKLQKQLYYLDSDIAGLKRKIRRKY